MSKPLYIVWNDSFLQGEDIIDEQHRGVLATINSLHYFLGQGLHIQTLMPTVKILGSYIMFHYRTEEGILHSTEYPGIKEYDAKMHEVLRALKEVCEDAYKNDDPESVLQFLKQWWLDHLRHHEEITPYLNKWSGDFCRVGS